HRRDHHDRGAHQYQLDHHDHHDHDDHRAADHHDRAPPGPGARPTPATRTDPGVLADDQLGAGVQPHPDDQQGDLPRDRRRSGPGHGGGQPAAERQHPDHDV